MKKAMVIFLLIILLTGCRSYKAGEAGVEIKGQIDDLSEGFEKLKDAAVEYPK